MENEQFDEQKYEKEAQTLLRKKQRERAVRQGQRKNSFLKAVARFFTLVLIISAVGYSLTLKGWYLPSDAFKTANPQVVLIVNNKIAKNDKIKSAIKNVKPSKVPIFVANMSQLQKSITDLSPVKSVYIRRYAFPARVLIIVREDTPIVSITPDVNVNPVAAYTKEGRLITGADYLPLPKEYDTLKVLSYGNKGDDYRKWDINRVKELQKLETYVETFTREQVEYIDIRNPEDIYVKVSSVLIRLGKNDSTIYERIKRLPSILPEAEKFKNKISYIDIRWDNVNYLKMK